MQLAEAVAIGLTTTGKVGAYPDHEQQQKSQRPMAPHQAVDAGTRAPAAASSGNRTPSGLARAGGNPKSMMACLDPFRSASLDIPATTKTRASNSRAMRSTVFMRHLLTRTS